jgi:hypothetical protein
MMMPIASITEAARTATETTAAAQAVASSARKRRRCLPGEIGFNEVPLRAACSLYTPVVIATREHYSLKDKSQFQRAACLHKPFSILTRAFALSSAFDGVVRDRCA